MKIAICFSGQTRTSTESFQNLERFFGDLMPDIDFFIHTWDIEQLRSKHWGPTAFQDRPISTVPNERFSMLSKLYSPKAITIQNFAQCKNELTAEYGRAPYKANWLWYSWYKSIMLADQYAQTAQIKYDTVIKLRTDIIFPSNRTLKADIDLYLKNTNSFYAENLTIDRIDDVYWIANMNNMKIATDYWKHSLTLESISFMDFLTDRNISLTTLDQRGYSILRKECVDLDPLKEFTKCYDCEQTYYGSNPPLKWLGVN